METLVLVLFVSSLAVGYTSKDHWNETVGLSLFAAAIVTAIVSIMIPSRKSS